LVARCVLDASALLVLLNNEPGEEQVRNALGIAVMSAVNHSEVVAKIVERGGTLKMVATMLDPLRVDIIPFDREHAMAAGGLRAVTRAGGSSFGDRACLALAATRQLTVLTSDRAWRNLDLAIQINVIR